MRRRAPIAMPVMRSGRARADAGVTLIELLITIAILGTVIAAITGSLILGLQVTDAAQDSLAGTRDAQILTAYFIDDAQSQTAVRRDVTTCAEGTAAGETPVVFFRWDQGGVAQAASYFTRSVAYGGITERHLFRRRCSGGAVASETTVGRALAATGPVIICTPSASDCPGSGAGTTATSVTMTVTTSGNYSFSLTATRRKT